MATHNPASPPRFIQRGNVEEGLSFLWYKGLWLKLISLRGLSIFRYLSLKLVGDPVQNAKKTVGNSFLGEVNKDKALRIKELEDELARKDSALVYAKRLMSRGLKRKRSLLLNLVKRRWKSLIAYVNFFLLWSNVFFRVMSTSIACPNPLTWLSKLDGAKDSARSALKKIS
ncbi:hypothetical protein Tco_1376685 [Tanacetum coccineum]